MTTASVPADPQPDNATRAATTPPTSTAHDRPRRRTPITLTWPPIRVDLCTRQRHPITWTGVITAERPPQTRHVNDGIGSDRQALHPAPWRPLPIYHSARVSGMAEPWAASATRSGLVVPSTHSGGDLGGQVPGDIPQGGDVRGELGPLGGRRRGGRLLDPGAHPAGAADAAPNWSRPIWCSLVSWLPSAVMRNTTHGKGHQIDGIRTGDRAWIRTAPLVGGIRSCRCRSSPEAPPGESCCPAGDDPPNG